MITVNRMKSNLPSTTLFMKEMYLSFFPSKVTVLYNINNFTFTGEEAEDVELEAPKIYEMVPSLDSLSERLKNFMMGYNETVRGGKMDLVFFKVPSFDIQHRFYFFVPCFLERENEYCS